MGTSTNAIIVYGMPFDPEETDDEKVADVFGDQFEDLEEATKEVGLIVEWHCSSEYPMYIIGHTAVTAFRGEPKALDFDHLSHAEIDYEKTRAGIKSVCEKFGLPFNESECKWWLCSYWG